MKRQTRLYFTRERMRKVRKGAHLQAETPSDREPLPAGKTAGSPEGSGKLSAAEDSHNGGVRTVIIGSLICSYCKLQSAFHRMPS